MISPNKIIVKSKLFYKFNDIDKIKFLEHQALTHIHVYKHFIYYRRCSRAFLAIDTHSFQIA